MKSIIGHNLRQLREASHFTQEQVASFLEIKRSAYSNYETGEREAPLDVLEKVSDLYGCDLNLLLEKNDDVAKDMLVCAFRVEHLSEPDMAEIAKFKNLVKNYLKISQLLS